MCRSEFYTLHRVTCPLHGKTILVGNYNKQNIAGYTLAGEHNGRTKMNCSVRVEHIKCNYRIIRLQIKYDRDNLLDKSGPNRSNLTVSAE